MPQKKSLSQGCAMLLAVFVVLPGAAWARAERVLYTFSCTQNSCPDGAFPQGLVFDRQGNLYGTTSSGGNQECPLNSSGGCGVVFKLTPQGDAHALYSFCAQGGNCTDGAIPVAGLVLDKNGNLYGATAAGGAYGQGTVFKVTPQGRETVLYSFCARGGRLCTDGSDPVAGLVLDRNGNLYGATAYGGDHGYGTVFKLTHGGHETVLYSFCARGGHLCTDGEYPAAGPVLDSNGNLYGTAAYGGANCQEGYGSGCGVVFKLTPEGQETVLYNFCAQNYCADGANPYTALIFDKKRNLYGATEYGGIFGGCHDQGCGVVFKLTPEGKETVLTRFKVGGTGGAVPSGLLLHHGTLFGVTALGGTNCEGDYGAGCGTVFELTPDGHEKILYSFCQQDNCADGAGPDSGLVLDRIGNLFGTTAFGGEYGCANFSGCGVVFKLTP